MQTFAELCHARGYIFISAGYSFLPKHTAFDILKDAEALLNSLTCSDGLASVLPDEYSVNPAKIAIVGSSAGGYVAQLVALQAKQHKIAALGLLWPMGGRMLNDAWLNSHIPDWFTRYGQSTTDRPDPLIEWFGSGTYLDYLTGKQGLSNTLRDLKEQQRLEAIPKEMRILFPEIRQAELPPSFLIQ